MDKFVIHGGHRLQGEVAISGSKNATLPIMTACLLTRDECVIRNAPDLADVTQQAVLLDRLGVRVRRDGQDLHLQTVREDFSHAEYDLVRKMRAGVCVLGPLLAKRGYARVSMPGGCAIGDRPIDIHLRGMAGLGADLDLKSGDIIASAKRLKGQDIFLGGPFGSTVTGTANVMMAATLAEGTTVIEHAACEPEVQDLGDYLNAMGARITGAGTPRITIEGVPELHGTDRPVIPDRIEAGTYMVGAALTGGNIRMRGARLDHLLAVADKLGRMGVTIRKYADGVEVIGNGRADATDLTTQPYPGFPTDLQAQLMVLLCLADGNSIVTEKIYPDRFMHVAELGRMGARIRKEGPTAIVMGVKELVGAPVMASDLRASAALVLAGIVARDVTEVRRVYHIDRGYEKIECKLNALGAQIQRVPETAKPGETAAE